MEFLSGYKTQFRRIWAELLTIRKIAAGSALWRAATYLSGKVSTGYAGLENDPFVDAVLAEHKVGMDDYSGSTGAQTEDSGARGAKHAKHPQVPQAAWRKERRSRPSLVRGSREASYRGRRHPVH